MLYYLESVVNFNMFVITSKSDLSFISSLYGQFRPFESEGGLLPSFLIQHNKWNKKITNALVEEKHIGNFVFYKKTDRLYWLSFSGSYLSLAEDFKSADVYLSNNVRFDGQHEISYLLMQAYMFRLVDTGNFMIHSAAIIMNGEGILFCGKSGAGKSTQARLWKSYRNADVLNYDKPCIIYEQGKYYVHGSPWSGKEALYCNEYVPLKAIVFVTKAKENKAVKLSPAQSFANLYLHNYVYPITKEIEKKYNSVINGVCNTIPIYNLYCDISENAVNVLYHELFTNINYNNEKMRRNMKYKVKDFLRMDKVADEYIVIPRGSEAIDFGATVVFNETGAFLWNSMHNYIDIDTLAELLSNKYSLDYADAIADVKAFISKMKDEGMLDENKVL